MSVKNTIINKFMKTSQEETSNESKDNVNEQSEEIGNIPDEFTNKLVTESEQNFPSINEVDEEQTKPFVYLDDNELSRDFLMDRDLTKQHTLQLVMYHINYSLDTPFLEFYLEKFDKLYNFPEKIFDNDKLNETINKIQETQQGGIDIQVEQRDDIELGVKTTIPDYVDMNPFEQQAFELFNNKTGFSDIIAENAYKGFVEQDGIIYVVFENKEKTIINEEQSCVWGVLDEILIKKSILQVPIQDSVYKLFSENVRLAHITRDDQSVDIPLIVYPVDKVNDIYENVYYSNETNQETYLITLPRETDEFGHIFTFTSEILPSNQDIENIKRMVIFSKDALYILTNPSKTLFEKYPMIRFKEDELTIWGISNYLMFTELL